MYNKNAFTFITEQLKMPINKSRKSIFLSKHVLDKRKLFRDPEELEIDYNIQEKFRSGEFDHVKQQYKKYRSRDFLLYNMKPDEYPGG